MFVRDECLTFSSSLISEVIDQDHVVNLVLLNLYVLTSYNDNNIDLKSNIANVHRDTSSLDYIITCIYNN